MSSLRPGQPIYPRSDSPEIDEDEQFLSDPSPLRRQQSDERTIYTASDASVCKLSSVQRGYYEDPFLLRLATLNANRKSPSNASMVRKPPIINRGYYARFKCIDNVISRFLELTQPVQQNIDLPQPPPETDGSAMDTINAPPHSPLATSSSSTTTTTTSSSTSSTTSFARQIINLGGGLDTLSLRLFSRNPQSLIIYEVDFPEVIEKKVRTLLSDPFMFNALLNPTNTPSPASAGSSTSSASNHSSPVSSPATKPFTTDFDLLEKMSQYRVSGGYHIGPLYLLSTDLRNDAKVIETLTQAGLDASLPTLTLTECVLVYLEKQSSQKLCDSISRLLVNNVWLSYDMINPTDAFGKTMLRNLRDAGFKVPGFTDYPTLETQMARFTNQGCADAASTHSITMLRAYEEMLPTDDKMRVNKLEMFDEVEEWQLLMSHYALTVAVKGDVLATIVSTIKV